MDRPRSLTVLWLTIHFAELIVFRSHINGELAELPADAVAEWKLEASLNQKPWRNQPTHDSEPFHLCCLPVKVDGAGLAERWRNTHAVSDLSEEQAQKENAVCCSGSKCRCPLAAVIWTKMVRMLWLDSRCSAWLDNLAAALCGCAVIGQHPTFLFLGLSFLMCVGVCVWFAKLVIAECTYYHSCCASSIRMLNDHIRRWRIQNPTRTDKASQTCLPRKADAASRLPTLVNHTFERSLYYILLHIRKIQIQIFWITNIQHGMIIRLWNARSAFLSENVPTI